ncbi:475_t:CDS:2 [Rhizophagus irregularis]|nr:475_t:CDS:2 [Rhizophagus irregularis]
MTAMIGSIGQSEMTATIESIERPEMIVMIELIGRPEMTAMIGLIETLTIESIGRPATIELIGHPEMTATIGAILYMYRRKLKKIKSLTKNLNHSTSISHPTNTDEGIFSLDYYTNNYASSYSDNKSSIYPSDASSYDDNKSSVYPSDKIIISQLDPGNRNYFVYAKSGKVKNDINSLILSEKNNKKSNNFSSSIRRSKKKSKVNFSQILSSIISPSDTIYDDEKADILANTTTSPVSSLPSNKCIQPKEILHGSQMTEIHLIRQYSDASDATITTVTSDATDFSDATITIDDNPILEMIKEGDLEMTKEGYLEMTKEGDLEMIKGVDLNNKIIITETKEVVLDMLPVNENDNDSNLKYSHSRESDIVNKYFYMAS